jgi:hypothetical protein
MANKRKHVHAPSFPSGFFFLTLEIFSSASIVNRPAERNIKISVKREVLDWTLGSNLKKKKKYHGTLGQYLRGGKKKTSRFI